MTDTTYNGWTNYATWRIQLEIVDDYVTNSLEHAEDTTVGEMAELLEDYVDDVLIGFGDVDEQASAMAVSYARAFVSDVNWHELAQHALDDLRGNALDAGLIDDEVDA